MSTVWFRDELESSLRLEDEELSDIESMFVQLQDSDAPPQKVDIGSIPDVEYDPGYGKPNAPKVLVYTRKRVYFLATYDGACWYVSVPRNPEEKPAYCPMVGGW